MAGRVRGPRRAGRGWPSEASRRAGRNTKLTPEPPPPPAQTCPPRCPQPHPTFIGVPGVTGEPRVPAAWKLPRLSGGHTPCRGDTEKGRGVAGGAPHPGAPEVTVCAETQGHDCRPQPFEHPLQSDDRVKTRPNPPPRHQGSAIATGAFAELSAHPLGDRTKVPNRAARKQQVPEPLGTGTFEINTPWETEWPVLSASEKRQYAANTSARSSSPFSSAAVCRTFS